MKPDDIFYHVDHIECDGCHKFYCHLVREEQDNNLRYCMTCFNHRNGLEKTKDVMKMLDEGWFMYNTLLWEIPAKEIPKNIYDIIPFIQKKGGN